MGDVDIPSTERDSSFYLMTAAMLAIALVLPFAYRVDIGPGPDSIRAMIWDYIESSWYTGFRLWNPLDTLPYTLLRLIFALMLPRLFTDKTSPQRVFLVGIIAELQPLVVSAPQVFLIDWPGGGDPWVPLYIPLPTMLMFGVILFLWFKYRRTK